VQYAFAKRDEEASSTLYTELDAKLREAGIMAGLRSTNVSVIDPARPPVSPIRPNPPLNLAVGVFSGVFVGMLAAFTLEHLDRNLRNIDEAEQITGAQILAVVPNLNGVREHGASGVDIVPVAEVSLRAPASLQAEAFTTLRTAVLLSSIDRPPKVIMVTSSLPGEGKSVVSINFSTALARRGARVLLVETDLRRPSLERYMKLPKGGGLSRALLGQPTSELVHFITPGLPGFAVLPAGMSTVSAPDLLASNKMRELVDSWRAEYDFVVLDTPPLLAVSDASVVARLADVSLLVVRFSRITRQALARAMRIFNNNHGNILGLVVNDLTPGNEEYYEYYGYTSHENYYAETSAHV
jgi:capsular exopolysaccharide synthesis family protein